MNRLARSWLLYGGMAAFLLGCTLIGTPLFWSPLSDGEWRFLMYCGIVSTTVGIVALVVAAFVG
jgi:hypothetical protein